jgi:hypothetical protein
MRSICIDKYLCDRWDSIEVIGLVLFTINVVVRFVTGIRRFHNQLSSPVPTSDSHPILLPLSAPPSNSYSFQQLSNAWTSTWRVNNRTQDRFDWTSILEF